MHSPMLLSVILLLPTILVWAVPSLFRRVAAASFLTATVLVVHPSPSSTVPVALAVSGGGKEFALKDISGQDFSAQKLAGLDFTQCDAAGTNFKKTNLKGTRFFRSNLRDADFSGADLTGASLEDTFFVGAKLTDSVLVGAYLSQSVTDAASIEAADFTDALMPSKVAKVLCARDDVGAANSKTGVTTSESLNCP